MDYTAREALEAGVNHVVLVVRADVQDELMDHIARFWPQEMEVTPVVQGPIAGTAQAVASAAPYVDDSFGVVNADDLYGDEGIGALVRETESLGPDEHAIIGYRLDQTVLTDAPVTRGICVCDADGYLEVIVEQQVQRAGTGGFTGRPLHSDPSDPPTVLSGQEIVSMNLWGFSEGIFDDLERALDLFDPDTAPHDEGKPPELLLPEVVAHLVAKDLARVRVVPTGGRCIGLTHPDDVPLVREIVAAELRL